MWWGREPLDWPAGRERSGGRERIVLLARWGVEEVEEDWLVTDYAR